MTDLKLHNYSNNAIEQRSIFHGLTALQGRHIAAYIRGLSVTVPAKGRPWNPPLQPGPGMSTATAAEFVAGSGIDSQLTYGNDMYEYLAPGGVETSWAYNQRIEVRDIPITLQLGSWSQWLPIFFPGDIFPQASTPFLSSTGYTNYRDVIDTMTPNNFASFQAKNYGKIYGGTTGLNGLKQFMQEQGTLTTDSAGTQPPSLFSTARMSVQQFAVKGQWEIAIEKQTFALDGQRADAVYGSHAITNGVAEGTIFETGQHKISVGPSGFLDGTKIASDDQSDAWYVAMAVMGSNNGYDTPQLFLDNAYFNSYRKLQQAKRPGAEFALFYAQITSVQSGNLHGNMYKFVVDPYDGTDWTAMWADTLGYSVKNPYYWYTSAEWTARMNSFATVLNALNASRSAAYWNTTFTNAGYTTCCNAATGLVREGFPGAVGAYYLTMFTVWGVDAGKIATLKAWLESITLFSGHNFNDDITAANQGSTANGATGDLSVAGSNKEITFTACPFGSTESMPMVISSTGGQVSELLFATGGGSSPCTAAGSPGTVTVNTIRPHTGTISVRYGCYPGMEPNQNAYDADTTRWFQCSNMLP